MTDATLSTVRNAARVLKAFLTREESIGVSELSRRLGLGKSAVHRLLTTLLAEGLVEQDPRTGGYRLGIVMFERPERSGNVISDWAGDLARRRGTLYAAFRLDFRHLEAQRLIHLAPVQDAGVGILLGDLLCGNLEPRLAVNRRPLLRLRHRSHASCELSSLALQPNRPRRWQRFT